MLTLNVLTMGKQAYERVASAHRIAGVLEASTSLTVGDAIEDLLLILECNLEGECDGRAVPDSVPTSELSCVH